MHHTLQRGEDGKRPQTYRKHVEFPVVVDEEQGERYHHEHVEGNTTSRKPGGKTPGFRVHDFKYRIPKPDDGEYGNIFVGGRGQLSCEND